MPEAEEGGEEITVDAPLTSAAAADAEPEFVIPEETDEELVDVAVEAEAPLPAPPSGGQDDFAIIDSTVCDMEEEVPDEPQDATVETDAVDAMMEITEPEVPEMTPGDLALVRGEAVATSMPPQPVTEFLPLPAPETGGRRRACPGCGFQHFVGQMICLGCGGSIIKASSQQQRRRVKTGRWFQEEAAARATGKRKSDLAVEDVITNMRTEAGGRGLQSLDSAALEKAKQIHKLADKKGFSTIVERFDNDVEFTLASIRQGYDREFLRIEDVLVHSALPNLGRSQAQRSLGTGTFGSGSGYDRVERMESIARLLYFDEPQGPAALRAGLIEVITDPPLCIMWLGVAYTRSDLSLKSSWHTRSLIVFNASIKLFGSTRAWSTLPTNGWHGSRNASPIRLLQDARPTRRSSARLGKVVRPRPVQTPATPLGRVARA